MTGLFQNGANENFILAIVSITTFYVGLWHMYMCLYQYILVFEQKQGTKLREMVFALFRKWNFFKNSRKDCKFGIDLVDSMLNTLQTLKVANIPVIYFHMKTLTYTVKPKYYSMIYV